MRRAFPVSYARDLTRTAEFYERLLRFERQYSSHLMATRDTSGCDAMRLISASSVTHRLAR